MLDSLMFAPALSTVFPITATGRDVWTTIDKLEDVERATRGDYHAALSLLEREHSRRALLAANRLRKAAGKHRDRIRDRSLSLGRNFHFRVKNHGEIEIREIA